MKFLKLSQIAILSLLLGTGASLYADGATSRGNLYRNGVYRTTGVTASPTLAWSFITDGEVRSAPVVYQGRVYVGSLDGFFYCLDATTGAELWKLPVGEGQSRGVEGSACIKNGVAYFGGLNGRIYAVDAATGEIKWEKRAGQTVLSTPAVAYETVFFFVDGKALGYDIHTGQPRWRAQFNQTPPNRVAVTMDADYVYYAVKDAFGLMVASLKDEVCVRHQSAGMYSRSTVAMNENYIVVTNAGNIGGAPGYPGITVYNRDSLTPTFQPRFIEEHLDPGDRLPTYSSPALFNDIVYIGMDSGFLYAIDAISGEIRWQFQAGAFRSSPSISAADNTLYVGSKDGYLYALDALNGAKRWSFRTDGPVRSDPVVRDGSVYFGSDDGKVYCISAP